MNRNFKKKKLKGLLLPRTLDSFIDTQEKGDERFSVEYDGWHFTGATLKSATNKMLKYIFDGGEQ